MPKLYSKTRLSFGSSKDFDIPSYQHPRTLREAIELSLSSYSYQEAGDGKVFQWDNLAPEVALVILQDAAKKGIFIKQEVIDNLRSREVYEDTILGKTLEVLKSTSDYALFTQKLTLQLTGKKSKTLTLDVLKDAGINTVEEFDKVYTRFLLE